MPEYEMTVAPGTVIDYFVSPRVRLKASELPYDLSTFRRDATAGPREIWYINDATGLIIVTEIVPDDGGIPGERLRAIEQRAPIRKRT